MLFLPRDVSWEEKYIQIVSGWNEKGFKGKSVSFPEVFILFSSEKCHATYQLSIVQIQKKIEISVIFGGPLYEKEKKGVETPDLIIKLDHKCLLMYSYWNSII